MPSDLSHVETLLAEILAPPGPDRGEEMPGPQMVVARGTRSNALPRKPFTVREWCRHHRIQAEKEPYCGRWQVPDSEARRLIEGGLLQPGSS